LAYIGVAVSVGGVQNGEGRFVGSVSRVLVVGGGIGGLSATLALRRAGVEVDVAEINPEWSVYGVGIIQPGNALRALDALGLAKDAIDQGFAMEGSRFHLADGTLLADLPFHRVAGPEYPPMNGITRSRLHVLLTDAVKASGADVRLGLTVDAIDGGHVTFSDGSEGDYDLIVGADGIHSRVRALVFGEDIQPEYTGQVCWRINVPRPPEVEGIWMFAGTNGKAGCVPLAPDLAYLLLIEEPPPGGERVPDDELAATMRERLAEFGGVIGELRDAHINRDEDVVLRSVMAMLVDPPWYRDRVVLIGDAAHATSPHVGQGAAMAIEDALVLAEEVTGEGTLQEALDRFMERRYERCKFVCDVSRQIGRWEIERRHDADFAGLTQQSVMVTAEPI
jgi:2-polyprenyl-6-methoxyphenol hydroxylase-like FAD-dependent oxidoreductase